MTFFKKLTATIATVMIGGILVTVTPSESQARCVNLPGLGPSCGSMKELKKLRGIKGARKVRSGRRKCTGKSKYDLVCIKHRRDGRCARERKITRHGC